MYFKKLVFRYFALFFEYDTIKILSIKSKKVGLICRFIQLLVLSYVIGYVIVYKKGYQNNETGISGLITKVKGVSLTNISGIYIWDVADFVIPPQETNAFFITTNALITRQQSQGKCPEDENTADAKCKKDSDCVSLEPILLGDGVKTGKCINNTICEVYAWCPVESSKADAITVKSPLLKNVNNFTVFIKNNIEFRKFKVFRSNIPSNFNKSTLNSCRYDPKINPNCPVLSIGTILSLTNNTYDDIAITGGIIDLNINWDCNLDYSVEKCFPTYSFNRLDLEKSSISKGWNFRYANYYYTNKKQYRDLIKTYGIRFIITVTSKAGKFDIIPLTMNFGSGIALLGLATLLCDFIVLYCLKNRRIYVDAKYNYVTGDDAFKPFESDLESSGD